MAQEIPSPNDHRTGFCVDDAERVKIPADWLAEFDAAARRPLKTRFRYAFIKTYKPVMDDQPFRAFATTAEYRKWCEESLPDWLGYGREQRGNWTCQGPRIITPFESISRLLVAKTLAGLEPVGQACRDPDVA